MAASTPQYARLTPVDSFHYWMFLVFSVHAAPWFFQVVFHPAGSFMRDEWTFLSTLVLWIGAVAVTTGALVVLFRYYSLRTSALPRVPGLFILAAAGGVVFCGVNLAVRHFRPAWLAFIPDEPITRCPIYLMLLFGPVLIVSPTLQRTLTDFSKLRAGLHPIPPKDRWEWAIWVSTAAAALTYGIHSGVGGHGGAAGEDHGMEAALIYGASAYKLAEAAVISVISIFFTSFVTSAQRVEQQIDEAARTFAEKLKSIEENTRRIDAAVEPVEQLHDEVRNATAKLNLAIKIQEFSDRVNGLVRRGAIESRMLNLRHATVKNLSEVLTLFAQDIEALNKRLDKGAECLSPGVASVALYATFMRTFYERLNRRSILFNESLPHVVRMETTFGHYCAAVRHVMRELLLLQSSPKCPYRFEFFTTYDGDALAWLDPWVWMQEARAENQKDPQWLIFVDIFCRSLCLEEKEKRPKLQRIFLVPQDESDRINPLISRRFEVEILCRSSPDSNLKPLPIVVWEKDKNWARDLKARDTTEHYRRLWDLDSESAQQKLAMDMWDRVHSPDTESLRTVLESLMKLYQRDENSNIHTKQNRVQSNDVPSVENWPKPSYVYRHPELKKYHHEWSELEKATGRSGKYIWRPLHDVVAEMNPQPVQIRSYIPGDKPSFTAFGPKTARDGATLTDVFAVRQIPKKTPDPDGLQASWTVCMAAQQTGDHGAALRLFFSTPGRDEKKDWENIEELLDKWFLHSPQSVDVLHPLGTLREWPGANPPRQTPEPPTIKVLAQVPNPSSPPSTPTN